ncbi:MAG TPA: hypothetical protein VGO25_14495 [Rhodanobacteraceae bacterium]|jgi:hypothetical protein|nr:hypothetical protein [Rhodanobacteraceae bacterium]
MNTCAPAAGELASFQAASLELRCAQRAFAAVIDAHGRVGEFRGAQLRSVARRTLSGLSADDRTRLAEWLSLQIAVGAKDIEHGALDLIARIEAGILARVRRALPRRVEALATRAESKHIVAA